MISALRRIGHIGRKRTGGTGAIRLLAAAGAMALVWCAARAASPAQATFPGSGAALPGSDPGPFDPSWSVQLHLHGPFSEGEGSIDSHSYEGREVGVDVIWWTEHDYRMRSFHMLSHFDFDATEQPLHTGEPWEPIGKWESKRTKRLESLVPNSKDWMIVDADERRVLALKSTRPVSTAKVELTASAASLKRPLAADIELELSVRTDGLTEASRGLLTFDLSEHAPREGLGLEPLQLRYRIEHGVDPDEPVHYGAPTRTGAVLEVPITIARDSWQRLTLPITRDAIAGFPFIEGDDNALRSVRLSLVTDASGSGGRLLFDDLTIRHGRGGEQMYAAQADLIERVSAEHPGLVQRQGIELSMVTPHLNAYLPEGEHVEFDAPDYGQLIAEHIEGPVDKLPNLGARLAPILVEAVHARGGLISVNHMFGASWGVARGKSKQREVLAELIAAGVHGGDLIEVGYRARGGHDLAMHLWVWDRLSRSGYPLVGTGVSDSHGGEENRWRTARNNFVSWIFAPSTARDDLLEGLRRGRVYFGDLTLFDGQLDLVSAAGFRMGQVVLTDRQRADLELHYAGAAEGDRLTVVVDGKPAPHHPLEAPAGRIAMPLELAPDHPTPVRFELGDRDGTYALSNPIVYTRELPLAGGALERLGFDLEGFVARDLGGLVLSGVTHGDDGVELTGHVPEGATAAFTIEFAAGPPPRVELDGFTGQAVQVDGRLEVTQLTGTGALRILR